MEMIYNQIVVDLGGETYIYIYIYFVIGCTRVLARCEREQMGVVGWEAVWKERLRTL